MNAESLIGLEAAHKMYEMADDYFNLGQQSVVHKYELPVQWGDSVLEAMFTKAYLMGSEKARKEIRDALVTDQATGAGDYSEAEEYADRIVRKTDNARN